MGTVAGDQINSNQIKKIAAPFGIEKSGRRTCSKMLDQSLTFGVLADGIEQTIDGFPQKGGFLRYLLLPELDAGKGGKGRYKLTACDMRCNT